MSGVACAENITEWTYDNNVVYEKGKSIGYLTCNNCYKTYKDKYSSIRVMMDL